MMPDDKDHSTAPGPVEAPLEDVASGIQKLFKDAHPAGSGSDPEAQPGLPSDEDAVAIAGASARLMDEAFGRQVDAHKELAEYQRTGRRTQ